MKEKWTKETTKSRPDVKKCVICHKVFITNEEFAVVERQYYFDDSEEVFYCVVCVPPNRRRELKLSV